MFLLKYPLNLAQTDSNTVKIYTIIDAKVFLGDKQQGSLENK